MKYKYLVDLKSRDTTGRYIKRPVVEIELSKGSKVRNFLAIIDSGADQIIMSTQIAEIFGIDWKNCPKNDLTGISGGRQKGYVSELDVSVKFIEEKLTFPVLFTEADIPVLLGQEGFFDSYRIKFEKDHDTFEIIKPKTRK